MSLSTNGVPQTPSQRLTVNNAEPMINSTSSSDRTSRTDAVTPGPQKTAGHGIIADNFSAEQSAALREALARQPDIRPEVVARGRALAADPSYPSPEILRKVSAAILSAPDLTEDVS
jgi:hypothetical protein